jgi:integrase
MLLSLLGLRPAEVCGLRWDDADLEAETIAIRTTRTLVATEHGMIVVEKATKTRAGKRTLPLPTQACAALTRSKVAQAAEQLAAGPAYQGTGYLLVDEIGEPLRTDWLRRQAYKLMATAGVRIGGQGRRYRCAARSPHPLPIPLSIRTCGFPAYGLPMIFWGTPCAAPPGARISGRSVPARRV